MKSWKTSAIALAALMGASSVSMAQERDQIWIVGSSTVYPFASYVVEEFGATTEYPTPTIESTGSGGGIAMFCEGTGKDTPDITNSSRRMQVGEFERCQENGVEKIVEAKIGSDGIAVAQSKSNDDFALTREQILLAVAKKVPQNGKLVDNPYEKWSDIDSDLPDREIEVLGPPTTSGTRDSFEELALEAVSEEAGYPGEYSDIRADGAYVDSGENDNLIVQRIVENTDAVGVFGFSFLEENRGKIEAITVDGVKPTTENISKEIYPISRSMFGYFKKAHEGDIVEGIGDYMSLFMSDLMIGSDGLLVGQGLIPMPEKERKKWKQRVADRVELKRSDLE